MKKIMSLMLGMTLVLGAVSMFAQDTPKTDTTTTDKKAKKTKKGKKKTDSTTPATDTKKP